ncbi:LysE family translocator [Helicobacter burdigaliensis]|uniref:LysE family translocator n=1 Tax=Helicobacter burdigaliensis TaxID=2315334 RepID=UPI000EF6DF18|nr:LysE family translocator [Helicobacter burdigaliensis]
MELLALFAVGFITAITPGPDILFVLRNTLALGARAGILSFLGIFSGWIIYLSLIYFGFAHFLRGALIEGILSLVGGIYLSYIAYILYKKPKNKIDFNHKTHKSKTLYFKGLFVNLSNPKAILFFMLIITPFIQKDLELSLSVLLVSLSLAFLCIIFLALNLRRFITNTLFDKIDKVCVVIFFIFALLLFSEAYQSFSSLPFYTF